MTARIWTPPVTAEPGAGIRIFLAGTIDNGSGEDWQQRAISALCPVAADIYNPRRAEWDSSWTQEEDNPVFREQVTWELDHIERADLVLMYFADGSLSPISLLELGLTAAVAPEKLRVCCAAGFWRKGNVDIVCSRYGLRRYGSFDQLLDAVVAEVTSVRDEVREASLSG